MFKLSNYFLFVLTSFLAFNLQAQNDIQLNISVGLAMTITNSDHYKEAFIWPSYSITGESSVGSSNTLSPSVHLGFTKPISDRFKGSVYAEYLFNNGELYANRVGGGTYYGNAYSISIPSKRKLQWFNTGAIVYYHLRKTPKSCFSIGSGLTVLISKHYYRNELVIEYDENADIISQNEFFTTSKRTLVGIPFRMEYDYQLNEQLSLNMGAKLDLYKDANNVNMGLFVGASFDLVNN